MKKARAKSNFLSIEERSQLINNGLNSDKEIKKKNDLHFWNTKTKEFSGIDFDTGYVYAFAVENEKVQGAYIRYTHYSSSNQSNSSFGKDIALSISIGKTDDIEVKKTLLNTLYS